MAAHFNARTRERIQEQKRALHLLKRAPYLLERAVYCQYRGGLPYSSFQSAHASAPRGILSRSIHEPYVFANEPYIFGKEPHIFGNEPYIFGDEVDYVAALFNART